MNPIENVLTRMAQANNADDNKKFKELDKELAGLQRRTVIANGGPHIVELAEEAKPSTTPASGKWFVEIEGESKADRKRRMKRERRARKKAAKN